MTGVPVTGADLQACQSEFRRNFGSLFESEVPQTLRYGT